MSDPVVLLPGMVSDARVFAPQIVALSSRAMVQVAHFGAADTIRAMAARVLEQAPAHFALVGHSMGGIVAQEVLRQAPARVTRVALISTTPLAETPAQSAAREPLIARARAGLYDVVLDEALPESLLAPGAARAGLLADLREMARALGAEAFVNHARALQRRRDYQGVLANLGLPALILCGALDPLTPPKRSEFMAGMIAGARLQIIDNAAHFPMLEAPDQVSALLRDFLDEPLVLR